jgi:hypothetical protein
LLQVLWKDIDQICAHLRQSAPRIAPVALRRMCLLDAGIRIVLRSDPNTSRSRRSGSGAKSRGSCIPDWALVW